MGSSLRAEWPGWKCADFRGWRLYQNPQNLHPSQKPLRAGPSVILQRIWIGTTPRTVPLDSHWSHVVKQGSLYRLAGCTSRGTGRQLYPEESGCNVNAEPIWLQGQPSKSAQGAGVSYSLPQMCGQSLRLAAEPKPHALLSRTNYSNESLLPEMWGSGQNHVAPCATILSVHLAKLRGALP